MSVVAAGLAGGARPEELPQSAWIDFRGDDGSLPRVDFDDVAAGRPEALAKLRGKVVLVGYTGKPPFRTSAPGASRMNPTEIQANAISTALDDFPLRDAGRLLDIALIVALGLLAPGLALRLRPALVVPIAVAAAALFCVAAQLAFAGGRVISVVAPLSSLGLSTFAVAAVLVLHGRRAARAKARAPAAAGAHPATA